MKKQKVTIRDITASLQTIGHDGFAEVELNHKCDERDSRGRLMFGESSEGQNETGN